MTEDYDERWRRWMMEDDEPHYPPEDYVPPEFHAEGRSSLAICQAIPNGPEVV